MKISSGVSALNVVELILTHGSKERMLTLTNGQLTIIIRSLKRVNREEALKTIC
jgi:hypothetical protein